jgi:hypothetical protein
MGLSIRRDLTSPGYRNEIASFSYVHYKYIYCSFDTLALALALKSHWDKAALINELRGELTSSNRILNNLTRDPGKPLIIGR